jgi:hypothetical protein
MNTTKKIEELVKQTRGVNINNAKSDYLTFHIVCEMDWYGEYNDFLYIDGSEDGYVKAHQVEMKLHKTQCPEVLRSLFNCIDSYETFKPDDFEKILTGEVKPENYEVLKY